MGDVLKKLTIILALASVLAFETAPVNASNGQTNQKRPVFVQAGVEDVGQKHERLLAKVWTKYTNRVEIRIVELGQKKRMKRAGRACEGKCVLWRIAFPMDANTPNELHSVIKVTNTRTGVSRWGRVTSILISDAG